MKKRGRPKTDDARTYGYRLRLNSKEQTQLEELQQISHLPKSQVLRQALLDYHRKITKQQRKEKV